MVTLQGLHKLFHVVIYYTVSLFSSLPMVKTSLAWPHPSEEIGRSPARTTDSHSSGIHFPVALIKPACEHTILSEALLLHAVRAQVL